MAEKDYNINIPKRLQNHGMVVHPGKTLCGSDDTLTILFLDALLRHTRKYIVKFITSAGIVATAEGVRLNEYILSVRLPKELPAGSAKINVYKPGTVTTHLGECTFEILCNLDMVCDLLRQSLKPEKILSREVNVRPDKFKSFYEILADAQRTIRNTGESAALDFGDFCDQYPTDTARTLELYSFADVFQTSKKRYHPRPKRKYDSVHTGVHLSDVSIQVEIPQAEESFENSSFINEMVNMRKKEKLPPVPAYPMPIYDGASITSMHLTDDWPMNYSVGTHTTGIFDSRGGFLFIQDTGVELFIPPGAIEQGKQQEVSIQLDRRPQNAPALGQGECLVSPVVMCKPSGLHFKVAVVLSFPLYVCGTDFKLTPLISLSTTSEGQSTCYESLSNANDGVCITTDGRCILLVNHFTNYTVKEGRVSAKHTKLMIFADLQDDVEITLRVWLLHPDCQQEVLDNETRLGGTEVCPPNPFAVDTSGGDVEVHLQCDRNWEVPIEVLNMTLSRIVANCGPFHEDVIMTKVNEAAERVRVDLQVSQPKSHQSDHASFRISRKIKQEQPAMPLQISRKLDTQQRELPTIPEGLCVAICQLMDPSNPCGRDWRLLADKVTVNGKSLNCCDRQLLMELLPFRSPTYQLLSIWQSFRKGFSLRYLEELKELFTCIDRTDVVELLEAFLGLCKSEGIAAADAGIRPPVHSQMCNKHFYTVDSIARCCHSNDQERNQQPLQLESENGASSNEIEGEAAAKGINQNCQGEPESHSTARADTMHQHVKTEVVKETRTRLLDIDYLQDVSHEHNEQHGIDVNENRKRDPQLSSGDFVTNLSILTNQLPNATNDRMRTSRSAEKPKEEGDEILVGGSICRKDTDAPSRKILHASHACQPMNGSSFCVCLNSHEKALSSTRNPHACTGRVFTAEALEYSTDAIEQMHLQSKNGTVYQSDSGNSDIARDSAYDSLWQCESQCTSHRSSGSGEPIPNM